VKSQDELVYLTGDQLIALHKQVRTAMKQTNIGIKNERAFTLFMEELSRALCETDGLWKKAALYLFRIIKEAPFKAGNLKTAILSAFLFLNVNQVEVALKSGRDIKGFIETVGGMSGNLAVHRIAIELEKCSQHAQLLPILETINDKYSKILTNLAKERTDNDAFSY